MRIGLDFGGVIVKSAVGSTSIDLTSGLDLMMPGAFDGIAELVTKSAGNIWIVSKASPSTQMATRNWLGKTRFYQLTNFAPSHIHFCGKRHEKRGICQMLELTHFIDDSAEVLDHLTGLVPNVYQFGSKMFPSWGELLSAIRPTTLDL